MKLHQRLTWKFLKRTYCQVAKRKYDITCVKKAEEPKPPYILLANHYYFTDGFHIGGFLEHPVRYLGSDEYTSFFQEFLDDSVGLIYIEKGHMRPSSVRSLCRTLKQGNSVGIFPEGDGCWDGETADFAAKIVKLVKKCGVPVLTVRNSGGYFTKPRWAETYRSGKIILEFDVIDVEEIRSLSDAELYRRIKENIYSNELKNPLVSGVDYKGERLAAGIQYLLWKCPSCGAEESIEGRGDEIRCSRCGHSWKLSGNLRISPKTEAARAASGERVAIADIKDWSDWQRSEIAAKVSRAKARGGEGAGVLAKSDSVRLETFAGTKRTPFREKQLFREAGQGELVLTKEALTLSLESGEKLSFETKGIKYYVECMNWFCKFYYEDKPYKLVFDGKNSARYLQLLDELGRSEAELVSS
jgi:1-acyl-sn-glycerol-3-phosphate acyltransferase